MSRRLRKKGHGNAGAANAVNGTSFWGDPDASAPARQLVTPTPRPTAVLDSLGLPPLHTNPYTTKALLEAVYDQAVHLAAALARANDLLDEGDHN